MLDALYADDRVSAGDIGIPIVLPATYISSPRQIRNAYLDAIALTRHFGSPNFFVTITCNPR